MKFITFLFLYSLLLPNNVNADSLLTKSEIINTSKKCFEDFQYQVCNNLILKMEKVQLFESEINRYKCQSSILGLQTELIESIYLKKSKTSQSSIMIPYVIKNC